MSQDLILSIVNWLDQESKWGKLWFHVDFKALISDCMSTIVLFASLKHLRRHDWELHSFSWALLLANTNFLWIISIGHAHKRKKYYASVSEFMSRAHKSSGFSGRERAACAHCEPYALTTFVLGPISYIQKIAFHSWQNLTQDPFILPFNFIQVNTSPSIIWPFLISFVTQKENYFKSFGSRKMLYPECMALCWNCFWNVLHKAQIFILL